jgi:hypothetical protein
MNKLKAILKVSAQAGQKVNKTSAESTAQDDDFQEVKRHTSYISINTLKRATSTKSIPTSTAVKLPPKAVLTRTIFALLRTTDMDTESTGTENTLPEKEVPRKPGRPPPIMMTFVTNLIQLQSDLKTTSFESMSSEIHEMEPV